MSTKTQPGTIIRTVVLILALVNQILTACGKPVLPIEEQHISDLVATGFTVITALVAWWKNNSFTLEAQRADRYLEQLKNTPIR